MLYQLSPRDYDLMLEQFGGDVDAAHAMLRERGYAIPGEETSDLAAMPTQGNAEGGEDEASDLAVTDVGSLSGILKGQRKSIGDLYDTITQNIQKRYRAPDINDLLIQVGMGMMSPPGEGDRGGFGGAVQRGLRGIGTYAQNRRAYETDMNKMMSEIEIQKAKDLAGLEEKYLTSAASAMKPVVPRAIGTEVVGNKIVAVMQDPKTGEITKTEIGEAPANLKQIPGVTSGNQPVFMGPNGPVNALGQPVVEFDVKSKPISAGEQREIFKTEDAIGTAMSTVRSLEEALTLNEQAYEGSLSGWRKTLGQLFSSDDPQYVATENFDNLQISAAIGNLKNIFPGAISNDERKAFNDLQAVSKYPRAVRDKIIRRAMAAAKSLIARETQRLERLKGGEYGTRGGSTAGGGRTIRYDKNGNRI